MEDLIEFKGLEDLGDEWEASFVSEFADNRLRVTMRLSKNLPDDKIISIARTRFHLICANAAEMSQSWNTDKE